MFHGAMKHSDHPEEYKATDGFPIRDDFQNLNVGKGSQVYNFATKGFGMPEEAYPKAQEAFARFLKEIQEVSFVPASLIVSSVGSPPSGFRFESHPVPPQQDPFLVHCSTLSIQNLKNTIKPGFEKFLREVIGFLPPSKIEGIFNDLLSSQENPSKNAQDHAVSMRMHSDFSPLLKNEDFLTSTVRSSLDKIENGTAEAVNNQLRAFAAYVLHRAELSFVSTLEDAALLRRHRDIEKISYSTLNPTDLMEMIRGRLKNLIPSLIVELPHETAQRLMKKL